MISPQPGQRIRIADRAECRIRVAGQHADRLGIAAIGARGAVCALEGGGGEWRLPSQGQPDAPFEIVAYLVDDRFGGFVNASYPIQVEIEGETYDLPRPDQQLSAVILAEIYVRDGVRRLKVSNDGFAFGIDAYARARNLHGVDIPFRRQAGTDAPAPGGERGHPGGLLASGSGVIVAPGLVATNAHVIEDGSGFRAGRTQQVLTPVAVDVVHDLALLQGEVGGAVLPLRTAAPVWLGESVMAAGFPLMDVLGADLKVTTGNISGLTGSHGDVSRFQFTAPIGSGSSGGAIIDEFGNLVGITSASLAHGHMRERGSVSENVNFGIKAALVHEMIAAAGMPLPQTATLTDNNRRNVVDRLRGSVISILVSG